MDMKGASKDSEIASMPRGGPGASWLDRRLQTDVLEYTDRYDVSDAVKQKVISALERLGTLTRDHQNNADTAVRLVADIPAPRILELGAGHGKLSEQILARHPRATVTVSDLDPTSVGLIAASDLGSDPRVRTQVIDATDIDAETDSYDLVVLAQAFHHLPPIAAYRAISEATRVGRQFLVIDLKRHALIPMALSTLAVGAVSAVLLPLSWVKPLMHDGIISGLRAYGRPAFVALGRWAHPQMRIKFLRPQTRGKGLLLSIVVFARPSVKGGAFA